MAVMAETEEPPRRPLWPFVAGMAAGAIGAAVYSALTSRRWLDTRLLKDSHRNPDVPPTVVVPGVLGSVLLRPDGSEAWLNLGNAFGHHDLSLPMVLPLTESRDDLTPGGLLGTDTVLPRLFGFTEYGDLVELLEAAGFERDTRRDGPGAWYSVFTYDWRRDLIEAARTLHQRLETLAEAVGDPQARFNVIGHSMGGLVARYYLRFGTAEPDGPVTWAGARRIRNLVLVTTPNAGSIPALDAILNGNRVGLSSTTLARSVIRTMPAIYQLLPPAGAPALLDHRAEPLAVDLLDRTTWERFGWGPYAPAAFKRRGPPPEDHDLEGHRAFLAAALGRARAFHEAMARSPQTPCPVRVVALGGDCLPTLGRALVPEREGAPPRFEPWTKAEADAMFEAGDGRVTRASVLASHLPSAEDDEHGSGLPEVSDAFFGSADHHGIYGEATFQSVLLRLLLRPARRRSARRAAGA
jgi:pimeloyl-ACP methyl ester carboxylesterase